MKKLKDSFNFNQYPKEMGYYFPAEFYTHYATWLSWPHNKNSWPGKINSIFKSYSLFIKYLAESELVCINIVDEKMKKKAIQILTENNTPLHNIEFYLHPTNDAWCRDHGPAFLINKDKENPKAIVDWNYNAWGNKYPPYNLDDVIPTLIGKAKNLPIFYPNIIMEGGSVEFNGAGSLITSTCCLLNPNRNKGLSKLDIEKYLVNYYGVEQILWVNDGIDGDDTDGHIDDTVRFINADSVIAVYENNKNNINYAPLKKNLGDLKKIRLLNNKQLNIVELPMPSPVIYKNQALPASYANFYISNKYVIVPIFNCKEDDIALQIIGDCFPDRKTIGIDSVDIIWGLGSFHCLSQQEPT